MFAPDELIISTHPRAGRTGSSAASSTSTRERFALPVTHVVVDLAVEQADERAGQHRLSASSRRAYGVERGLSAAGVRQVPACRRRRRSRPAPGAARTRAT